jgi:outer membrane biosynthesis protein TonB
MQKSLAISATAHAAVLAWGMISFATGPYKTEVTEALPIDIISAIDFSQMTAGTKNGSKDATAPRAEDVGERKPADDPNAKIVKQNEVKATSDVPPPPVPKPPTPAPKAQPPQPKRDLIAEALKKDETKKPNTKQADAKTPIPPRKPPLPAVPAFDANQVLALLDKRAPQRQTASADATNNTSALGSAKGHDAQLSQGELAALRQRLSECWSPPVGARDADRLRVVIRVIFNPDGTVARTPSLVEATVSPLGPATAESAMRAILRCQPFNMLKPEHFEQWKDIEITFDPKTMFSG